MAESNSHVEEIRILEDAVDALVGSSSSLSGAPDNQDWQGIREVLLNVATAMQDNYPYQDPHYAGQMLKPPHPVARLAYALSLWVNPNNHALDGGRASSAMEKAVIPQLARLAGWDDTLGHLTGGGTMANLESLWIAGKLHPGKVILGSEQAHYTHGRISEVLGLPYESVAVTPDGRMDLAALASRLERGDVGTVVATMGTTGFGAVDPLVGILDACASHGIRVHADAAYGGYFGLTESLNGHARASYAALGGVDSLVIDPHKHGLQPYGCGSVLFRDPAVGRFYKHGSPYTYFSSTELHLGEISLECSRPGAAAVALWATLELLPLEPGGEFAAMLEQCLAAARDLHERLGASPNYQPLHEPDLDILVYAAAADDFAAASSAARRIFDAAAARNLHLALIEVPANMAKHSLPDMDANRDSVTCLRSTLMKPEHRSAVPGIVDTLEEVAD